ncbi:apolipoprotein N-acyltransferase [Tropicimonas marinistellae]|uniref:apolipoprotein N-acyltransferase n=1 Tax=Tropicimonas marinistellae TaxID=1739787 RepID=UPI000834A031|nr:apolipoprotein N-acyltransferase [Tropicimonas marinistellae]
MAAVFARAVEARRSGFGICLGLGALAATGQAPLGWAWGALAVFAVALALLSLPARWQTAAWRGWALGTGYFAAALFWIVEPFLVDIARHGWMAPFALAFLAGGLGLFWALAFGLAARLGHTQRQRAGLAVVALTSAEMLRSFVFTGFPWALVGHIWIGTPQMQLASIAGAHGLTLLTLFAAALPTLFGARRALLGALFGAALVSLPAGWAHLRVPSGPAAPAEPAVTVRLVQPNAAQHLKWDPELMPVYFERQLGFTAAPPTAGAQRPDVVIWPETAVPWLLDNAAHAFRLMADAADGAQVLAGVQRREMDGRWFNTLVTLDESGAVTGRYDKHHLVPFGEYMPFSSLFSRLSIFGLAANASGGYSAGPGPVLLDLGNAGTILPLICYEAIFPNDIARAPGRADWLVQVTNDAWFGRLAGPYQHLALARLRAVEQGVPLVRAANTGVSAAFDPFGRELVRLPLGEAGYTDLRLPAPLPPTPYSRFGDLPLVPLLAAMAVAALLQGRRPRDS